MVPVSSGMDGRFLKGESRVLYSSTHLTNPSTQSLPPLMLTDYLPLSLSCWTHTETSGGSLHFTSDNQDQFYILALTRGDQAESRFMTWLTALPNTRPKHQPGHV